jgi:uncharacterized membrane protein
MWRLTWLLVFDFGCDRKQTTVETAVVSECDSGIPALTWDNFGQGFLLENCQSCHAGSAQNRHDAPEKVTFDNKAQAWYWAERILARALGDEADMPPAGGVSEDDKQRLEWWLTCAEVGT